MTWEEAGAEVKDTLVVAEIQRRQAEVQRVQAQEVDAARRQMAHIRQNLDGAADKLNGVIGWLDDFTRRQSARRPSARRPSK